MLRSSDIRGDVLVTGATGFLGMELVARLLEEGDRRVWVLVRASDEDGARGRMRATLSSLVADPDSLWDRIVPVAGDLTLPRLGIDLRRRAELTEQVGEVIHSAASVSFSLPLREARAVNVEGTRSVLELAGEIQRRGGLRRLAHVSTAYIAGTHRGMFGEACLDCGQDFHNSYERSKWEAECMVHAHADRLPVQVFRPSIVVGHELTGWTSSFNVIYTPLRAFAKGALPAVPARRSAPVDIVPVSYVARAILGLADAGSGRTFQLAAGSQASTVGELIDRAARHLGRRPVRAVPPGLYRRALRPVLARRGGPAQRRWLERGEVFFPYFAANVTFDTAATRAALDPLGIRVPPVADYFEQLLDFAVWANWGRRPVGRAEASARRLPADAPLPGRMPAPAAAVA